MMKMIKILFVLLLLSCTSHQLFHGEKNKCVFIHPVKGTICSHKYELPLSGVVPKFYGYNAGLLDSVEHFIRANAVIILGIKVHSGVLGSNEYNENITKTIKYAIVTHFVNRLTIDTSRIKVFAMGESKPLVKEEKVMKSKNKTEVDAQNRRLEFDILGYKLE